jgi:hypothetical protein
VRSQLFGFHIQTHFIYEVLLSCPLAQAHNQIVQHTRKFSAAIEQPIENQLRTVLTGSPTSLGVDIPLNDWSEETINIFRQVIRDYALADEWSRMQALQKALSWLWPKFRETAVAAQFLLAATIDEQTHLMLMVGWNEGAAEADKAFADRFIQEYFDYLKQLAVPIAWCAASSAEAASPAKPPYGTRDDTLEKIQALRQARDKHRREHKAVPTRTEACQRAGIAPVTVKKRAPELYERWYDLNY